MLNAIKRLIIIMIGFLLQIGFGVFIRLYLNEHIGLVNMFYELTSLIIVLMFLRNSTRLSNDVPWMILILLFPIFGTILFITLGRNYSKNRLLKNIKDTEYRFSKYLVQDEEIRNEIENNNLDNLKYILNRTIYPVSKNNEVVYYETGEKFFPDLLEELRKAEKFIFMEYFIITKGEMWNSILAILKEKASLGIDVRILYDDMGSFTRLTTKYPKELGKYGIKCIPFNKMTPFKGIFMNNRDHRKMTIIDGKVAFSGGVNLSDEYINVINRFGIWKDNAIKITGDAIWNLTVMFLTLWNSNKKEDKDILKFKYDFKDKKNKGYVVAYGIGPGHHDLVGEDIYINIINSSKKYLYIMTPYLVIDTDMVNALLRASKRGVDVRIIVPGIPDKKIVYTLTCSFFKILSEGGVKIYKFKDGFIHSKVFISDDIRSVVGTINMDYRSLYLHFENGIYMEDVKEIDMVKNDFEDTLNQCDEIQKKDMEAGIIKSIWQAILRLFAPLF